MTELQDHSELKGAQRPRTAARVAAIQALFQIEQNEDRPESVIQQFLVHRFGTTLDNASYEEGFIPEADTHLFSTIVRQGVAERGVILEQLTQTLPATWPVARLDPVLRALFQAALGEALESSVPARVLINEYIDIAHGFFSGDEPKLVNGVLDTIMKRLASVPTEEAEEKKVVPLTDLPQEFSFIHRHFSELAGPAALGLKDDAAVFAPPAGKELVIAADAMVENVHFLSDDPPETIGRKLLRCNLSDLAAMGATPEGWLLTLARPPGLDDSWFTAFCSGLKADQKQFGLSLMGGDTTSTQGPLVLSLTILGSVLRGQAIRRVGARAGDGLWVTGTIGDGALGLRVLQGLLMDPSGHLSSRYRLPQPRIGLPLYGLASAAMDVSDGLLQDAGHLARESGLAVTLTANAVPLSDAARACGPDWLDVRLTGGDDYEILFAVPPEHEAALKRAGALETPHGPVSVTRIGQFHEGNVGVQVLDAAGQTMPFTKGGWSHL